MDNIRRKAPAPRKPPQVADENVPTQQVDLINTQLVATQQQLQQLSERYQDLHMHHSLLVQELIGVQKTVVNHEHVMQNVMNYLHTVDARQRRDSKIGGPFAPQEESAVPPAENVEQPQPQVSSMEDEPASPLQEASKLLNDLNADVQLNYKNLEHMNELHNRGNGVMSTPPSDGTRGHARATTSAGSSTSMGYARLHQGDADAIVYPVGQTNGIDPMYSEHINNIPYPMPPKDQGIAENHVAATTSRKKSTQIDPGWIRPPQILLVEDDPTCRRIGSKFLYSFHCAIDSAVCILRNSCPMSLADNSSSTV